jgi:hypothetical protein
VGELEPELLAMGGLRFGSLIVLILASCLHSSPDAEILAPLGSRLESGLYDEGNQPVYVVFADPLTAGVFKNLGRRGHYRIAPKDARLVCPSADARGMQGYQLRVSVEKIMGDTALAAIHRMCVVQLSDTAQTYPQGVQFGGPSQLIYMRENILLVRVKRKWKFDTIISGSTSVMS